MRLYFLVYIVIGILRFGAYLATGYLVMLAEFFHGIIDLIILSVLKKSQSISLKPPDEQHPYGHGLAENIGALTVSIAFITLVSFELFREGIGRILTPGEFFYPEVAVSILFLTLALLFLSFYKASKGKDSLSKAIKTELLNDTLSTSAAILGIVLSRIYPVADGFFTIFIGAIIASNALRLYRENASILLGRSPDEDFYFKLKDVIKSFKEIRDVHDVSAIYIGRNRVHLDMHVTVDGNMSVKEADELTVKISSKIKNKIPEVDFVSIHVCSETSGKLKITDGISKD